MALVQVTSPASEPLSVTEAKAHLRVDHTSDDDLITSLISAARHHAEAFLNRALITQAWERVLDRFPCSSDRPIELRAPLQSVTSVTYTDSDGQSQTWASSNYIVDTDSKPGRLLPAYTVAWPTTRDVINAVRVRFVAGYGANGSAVPQDIRLGMLLLVGHLYEHREAVTPTAMATLPMGVEALWWPHRVVTF